MCGRCSRLVHSGSRCDDSHISSGRCPGFTHSSQLTPHSACPQGASRCNRWRCCKWYCISLQPHVRQYPLHHDVRHLPRSTALATHAPHASRPTHTLISRRHALSHVCAPAARLPPWFMLSRLSGAGWVRASPPSLGSLSAEPSSPRRWATRLNLAVCPHVVTRFHGCVSSSRSYVIVFDAAATAAPTAIESYSC